VETDFLDIDQIKRTAVGAAYKGGAFIRERFGKIRKVSKKGAIDLVTEADIGAEEIIIEAVRSRYPDHGILAEESGAENADAPCLWTIDPLDGTTNFAHGLGIFSVSIAFSVRGDAKVGVVFNPMTGELFSAVRGRGADLNGRPIRASLVRDLSESLLVTGFPYNFSEIMTDALAVFGRFMKASRGVRRLGSAALDLCFVACGRFEGFWEQNLNPWDTAAGALIAREAGAIVTDFSGASHRPEKKEILAAGPNAHPKMLSLLQI
jgi:myo-inositol-1(or 4)-monophosphatase